jgi:hypothetical protein
MELNEDKGEWVVPDELGTGDEDDAVLGRTTGSNEPATEEGIDLSAGDDADATADGGVELPEEGEPDLKDAMGAHNRPEADTG